jgi:hypothetical protein
LKGWVAVNFKALISSDEHLTLVSHASDVELQPNGVHHDGTVGIRPLDHGLFDVVKSTLLSFSSLNVSHVYSDGVHALVHHSSHHVDVVVAAWSILARVR